MSTGRAKVTRDREFLGSTGRRPVVRGSLPRTIVSDRVCSVIAVRAILRSARRPNATGQRPVLPSRRIMRRRAFTLIEITLAVAILGMMSLAIYRFVQTNIVALRIAADAP